MNKGKEIEKVPSAVLVEPEETTMSRDDIVSLSEAAESLSQAMRKIRLVSLQQTSVHDWTDQGGKPYLQSTGAEKLMTPFGIYTKDVKIEIEMDAKTGLPCYNVTGRAGSHFSKNEIDVVGGRNANDQFFTKQLQATGKLDLLDVRKAAYSNWLVNAVTRVIGLRGLTWEEVEEMTKGKISRGKVTGQVVYKPKSAEQPAPSQAHPSAAAPAAAQPQADDDDPPEIVRFKKLVGMIGSVDPSQAPDDICKKYFTFKDKTHPTFEKVCAKFRTEKLRGWVKETCEKIEKEYATVLPPAQDEGNLFEDGENIL